MTAPAVDPATVLPDRYVPRRAGGEKVAHLLTSTWAAQPGGHRPAACGVRARTWQSTRLLVDPHAPSSCPDCLRVTGRGSKAGPAVRFAPCPAPHPGTNDRVGEPARPPLTAAQRAQRRLQFGRSFTGS